MYIWFSRAHLVVCLKNITLKPDIPLPKHEVLGGPLQDLRCVPLRFSTIVGRWSEILSQPFGISAYFFFSRVSGRVFTDLKAQKQRHFLFNVGWSRMMEVNVPVLWGIWAQLRHAELLPFFSTLLHFFWGENLRQTAQGLVSCRVERMAGLIFFSGRKEKTIPEDPCMVNIP